MATKKNAAIMAEYAAQQRQFGESEYWINYHISRTAEFVRLSCGFIITIAKPRIETSFCFGESGYDYDEALAKARAARSNHDFFRQENLKPIQRWIDALEGDGCVWAHYWKPGQVELYCTVTDFVPPYLDGDKLVRLNDIDRKAMLDAYRKVYAGFEKRLSAYLKRYGLSKVHSWTYWRDA